MTLNQAVLHLVQTTAPCETEGACLGLINLLNGRFEKIDTAGTTTSLRLREFMFGMLINPTRGDIFSDVTTLVGWVLCNLNSLLHLD